MTSFHTEKCCQLASKHEASGAAKYASSWSHLFSPRSRRRDAIRRYVEFLEQHLLRRATSHDTSQWYLCGCEVVDCDSSSLLLTLTINRDCTAHWSIDDSCSKIRSSGGLEVWNKALAAKPAWSVAPAKGLSTLSTKLPEMATSLPETATLLTFLATICCRFRQLCC